MKVDSPPASFPLVPSRYQLLTLAAGYGLIVLVIAFLPTSVTVRVASSLLVIVVGVLAMVRLMGRRRERLVLDNGSWQWQGAGGEVRDLACSVTFRSPWLVVLRTSPTIGPVNIALWRDSTDAESWRQLHLFAAKAGG